MPDCKAAIFEAWGRSWDSRIWEDIRVAAEAAHASLEPEKRLMLTVLLDAARTLHKQVRAEHRRGVRPLSEAEKWFAADNTDWPFSFVNICEALGLNASRLRSGLASWRESQEATRAANSRSSSKQTRSYWSGAREAGLFRWSF